MWYLREARKEEIIVQKKNKKNGFKCIVALMTLVATPVHAADSCKDKHVINKYEYVLTNNVWNRKTEGEQCINNTGW